jgi:hypothetical protein
MVCVQHGAFFPSELLDATFGLGSAAHAAHLAHQGVPLARRCPQDRLAMTSITNASGRVRCEACTRCGSLWLPGDVLDIVERTTPAPPDATPADARSLLAFGAIRSVLTPAGKTSAR